MKKLFILENEHDRIYVAAKTMFDALEGTNFNPTRAEEIADETRLYIVNES